MKRFLNLLALSGSVLLSAITTPLAGADAPASPAMFPFVIPWDDASKGGAIDVSFLNGGAAGANGYIIVKDGHFAEASTGRRIRFLGTNFTFGSNFPAHGDAEKIAAHIAKLGINIVRIHHHDINDSPLWDKSVPGHTKFDCAALDRLDYLIAQFKKNGVYVDLNLHVSRQFVPEDGFPASVNDIPGLFDKRIDNIDRHMIDLQKQFARDYLTRVNPYTGMSYAADPCVALVEINNEDSLVEWGEGAAYCNSLPEPFRGEVVAAWSEWLARKYGTDSHLLTALFPPNADQSGPSNLLSAATKWSLEDRTGAAKMTLTGGGSATSLPDIQVNSPVLPAKDWHVQAHIAGLNPVEGRMYTLSFRAKADAPRALGVSLGLDQADWHNMGFTSSATLGTDWKVFHYSFLASNVAAKHARLSFVIGGATDTVSLADVSLALATAQTAFDTGVNLAACNYPIQCTGAADFNRFLADTEASYASEMRDFLRSDLGVHANLVEAQTTHGGLSSFNREAGSDFSDDHAYWGHPKFPHDTWDPGNWTFDNSPMVNALAKGEPSTFEQLAEHRMGGKPFTVSEYCHPAPSDYQAEMFPEIATFASVQDWDAIFEFDIGGFGGDKKHDKMWGFFAMLTNPAKEAFLPAAALIFRTGALAALQDVTTLHLSATAPFTGHGTEDEWAQSSAGKAPDILSTRLEARLDPEATSSRLVRSGALPTSPGGVRAVTTPSGAVYEAVSDRAVAAAGFVGGQTFSLGDASFTFPAFGNNFASFALTPLDGAALNRSRHLLLTIVGKVENLDMGWNAARTTVGRNWGHGPVQAEGIPATLTIANPFLKHVWALDPTGARAAEVPSTTRDGVLAFSIDPACRTIWYEAGE